MGFIEPRALTGEFAPACEAPGRRTLLEVELARAAEQPRLPAPAALRYARWLLAADRGWTEIPSTLQVPPGDAQSHAEPSTRQRRERRELLVALQRVPRTPQPTPRAASTDEAAEPMAPAQPWHGGKTRPMAAVAPAVPLAARGAASARDPEQLEDVLALVQRCGDGVPLSAELAARMQAELGHPFAQVRVHLGAEAAEACAALGAEAFTLGHHIYFGAGQFAPDTDDGSRLLRHELTHVVQHARGELAAGSRAELLSPSSSAEAEARAAEAPRPRPAPIWAGGPEPAPAQLEERRRRAAAAWDTTLEQPPAPQRRAVAMPTWAGAPMTPEADPAAATTSASATAIARRAGAPAAARGGDSGAAAALPTVVTLTGTFAPPSNVAAHIDKAGEAGAAVKVALPKLTQPAVILVKKVEGRYVTVEDKPQMVPLSHPLFVRAGAIAPMLRVRIGAGQDNVVTGYIAAGPTGADPGALQSALRQDLSALGLRGFAIPSLALVNSFENGVLTFGTGAEVGFTLGGWVNGQLSLGLSNDKVTFAARAAVHAKGLKEAEIRFSRDARGKISGSAAIGTDLGPHFTGNVNARYDNGDLTVRGELGYQSEKLSGKLSVMLADAAQAEAMVNAELPPDSVLPAGGAGAAPAAPAGKGKRGLAGTGNLNFAFTDWLTGTAKVVYGPSGHLTVIGKIAPPKQIELMKQKRIDQPILPEVRLQAGYGIPYVADIHVGVGVGLSASAGLGPIVLTDMALDGIYSTDPKVLNKFSITGTLRAQADAGLQLSVKGYAGLTLLGHSINFGAEVLGKAGVKGYAEARTTLGYRETAAPSAGKKGEYYLQGHLEMAAQPVLSLGGNLFIQLDSPWWSPAPDKTWRWPLGSLEYPVPAQFGIGADIDYVIGSGKLPDFKLTKPSFDASKFVDSMMSNRLPARSGKAGKQDKPGTWSGQKPSKPTESRPAVQPRTPKDASVTAGSPSGKLNQGNQTPEERRQTPADPAVAKRWNEGMEALGHLKRRAEKDPETKDEITQHLAELKAKYGYTKLTATRSGQMWLVDAVMNPEHKVQIQADPKEKPGEEGKGAAGAEDLQVKALVEPAPAIISAKGQLATDVAKATAGQVLFDNGADAKSAAKAVLRDHKDARFDKTTGTLTLPPVKSPNPAAPLKDIATDVARQTGVSRITVQKADHKVTLRGEINPWTPLATVQGDAGTTTERLQLAQAVQEFYQEFTAEQWMKHFALEKSQAYADLAAAQALTPPQISKVRHGKFQLAGPAWTQLKAEIVSRFKLTARGVITTVPFGLPELEHLCEHDPKLPKECPEYKDVAKMTEVLDALVAERAVRKTSSGKYEFTPVPPQRFLPAGWTGDEVRRYYFENGSGFGSLRDKMCQDVCHEVVAVIAVYEEAENALARGDSTEHEKLKRKGDLKWSVLHQKQKVSKDHSTYPGADWKDRYASVSSYHADHVEPLAWLWEHGGFNDVEHSRRLEKCGGTGKNLQPMWGPDNSGKGAKGADGKVGEYMRKPWVGPSFTGPATSGDLMDAGYGAAFRVSI